MTLLRRLFLASLLLFAAASSQAAVLPLRQQGLQISLTTSRYEMPVAASDSADSFTASVALTNLSNKVVAFSFPNPASAALPFKFRVLDSTGAEVWASDASLETPIVATPRSLASRSTWKRTLQVPTNLAGEPLPAGRYTLEATLAGIPAVAASSVFTITAPAPVGLTGIRGQVTKNSGPIILSNAPTTSIDVSIIPVPGTGVPAQLEITEVRLPNARYAHPAFSWSGSTDPDGFYQVTTPPGTFLVKVRPAGGVLYPGPIITPIPIAQQKASKALAINYPYATQATVVVQSGSLTEQNFRLSSLIITPVPPVDSGIKGKVLLEELVSTTALGSLPQIVTSPIAGAKVQISPIFFQYANLQLLPFGWTGTTDEHGEFKANLRPGAYRVRAYTLTSAGQSMLIDTTTVVVQSAQFTSVELRKRITPVVSPEAQEIYRVNAVVLKSSDADSLTVEAQGTVTSGGWSQGQLVPRLSTSNSVLEFDFVATPPSGIATQALSPITATVTIQHPQDVTTIRVYSNQNSEEITVAHTVVLGSVPR